MTTKQARAAANLVENGGNVTKAMIDAGYSPATANSPGNLTKSKGFQELADEFLPDSFLLQALNEDIVANPGKRKGELELAFKIKGKVSGGTDTPTGGNTYNTQVNINDITPRGKQMVDAFTEFMKEATIPDENSN